MKKILFATLLAGSLLSSCDMDLAPVGVLDNNTAIQSVADCRSMRNNLYAGLRAMHSGDYLAYPEIQMDLFHGMINNGNRYGQWSNGLLTPGTSEFEGFWGAMYSRINSANFLLEKIPEVAQTDLKDGEDAKLKLYEGEARFARAYFYFWLADHFCPVYSEANANSNVGLPMVTKYYPTGDRGAYPGRSTLAETFQFIESEMAAAYNLLKEYEQTDSKQLAPNAPYLSSCAIKAIQARVALVKGDYNTALAAAEEVINSGYYTLTGVDKYDTMWTEDTGSEVIFRPYMSNQELGSASGVPYQSNYDICDYIPTADILYLYDDGDVRFDAFFLAKYMNVEGTQVPAYTFNKFPGNEALWTTSENNFVNMPKAIRLSEVYLIAAEAAAAKGDNQKGTKYLNDLRTARIEGYDTSMTGNMATDVLMSAVREERLKELVGEGFRLSDLRRWHQGFSRNPAHPELPGLEDYIVKAGKALSYSADDPRFVWPIPTAEMENNPQLEGQQNPGY